MRRRTHSYGRGRSRVGELFLPDGRGSFPVAVAIHGGFWRRGYGRGLMDALCADLAGRGWAAWNLEYRRVGPLAGGGWPATFEDVDLGIDALAALDAPLDLGRVVAVGHSAGGHLALWSASRAAPGVRLTHAVSQAGVCDLVTAARLGLGRNAAQALLRGSPDAVPERYEAASPAARLPLGVPQLLVHGDRDDRVPLAMSERYAEEARAAGDDVALVALGGVGHFEHLDPASEAWQAVVEWLP